jgi:hypothetical protein
MNGRRRILDGGFNAIAPDENAAAAQSHSFILLHGDRHGIHHVFGIPGIDNPEHIDKSPAYGLSARPARHRFSHLIEIRHLARHIGANDGIAN